MAVDRAHRLMLVQLLVLGALSSVSPGKATPQKPFVESQANFGIDLWVDPRSYNSEGVWSVAVTVDNHLSNDGVAHVGVSHGVEIVKGDTVRSIPPNRIIMWPLYLRRSQVSRVKLTGSVRLQGNDSTSYDIGEQIVELGFDEKGMQVLDKRVTREIAVRKGQRFRYAGMVMVPVDSDDVESPSHFDSRAELRKGKAIECRGCGLDSTIEVWVLVTVGRNGKVTWIQPPHPYIGTRVDRHGKALRPVDASIWPAVSDGVRRYKFRPAKVDGRTTADWATLTVQVVPKR